MVEKERQTQAGVKFSKGIVRCTQVDIPQPEEDHLRIDTRKYSGVLPQADPRHLLLASVPFSDLVGPAVVVVYDTSSVQEPNPCATRLTISLEHGFGVPIHGDAVAFYTTPGLDFTIEKWAELDNCIFGELIEVFEEGRSPTDDELAQLVLNFHAGKYRYTEHEGEEDEDENKDDGGKELWETLQPSRAEDGETPGMDRPPSEANFRPLVAGGHPGTV